MRTRATLLALAAGLLLTTACTSEATSAVSVPDSLPSQPSANEPANQDAAKRFTNASATDGDPLPLKVTHIIDTVDSGQPYTYLITAEGTPSSQDISALIDEWTSWPDRSTETSMIGVYSADGSRIGSATIDSAAKVNSPRG